MFRQLTKEERHLTLSGIKKQEKEIVELRELDELYSLRKSFLKAKHSYEAKAYPINAKAEDEEVEKTLGNIKDKITASQKSIETMNSHLKNGVEIKENKQVR